MRYRLRNRTIISRNIANSTIKTANKESTKQLRTKPQFSSLQKSLSNHIFNGKRAIKTRKNSDIKIKKAQNRLKIKKKATKTVKATGKTIKTPVSEEANAYEPLIRIYAQKHGIPDYIELIKAVMMQESGGQGQWFWRYRQQIYC